MDIPILGLGTYDLRNKECTKIVQEALKVGYRHIDTAQVYGNHKAIGKGLQGFERSELFVTSKFLLEQINPKKAETSVQKACNRALKELGLEYLDLYLIHWPDRTFPISEVLKTMEALVSAGKVRHIGVSNFTVHHLKDLHRDGCRPEANQVEFHPYLYQKPLLEYCRRHKIQLIAYRPFGKGKLLKDALLKELGDQHQRSPAQIILRWLVQHKIPTIPKASSIEHLKENFAIFDFALSHAEMQKLDSLHRNLRFCKPDDSAFDY